MYELNEVSDDCVAPRIVAWLAIFVAVAVLIGNLLGGITGSFVGAIVSFIPGACAAGMIVVTIAE